MTRYVIDAATLVHVVANDVHVSPRHQIVAPNTHSFSSALPAP